MFQQFLILLQKSLSSNSLLARFAGALMLTSINSYAFAQATGGLSRTQTAVEMLRDNLYIILPIVAMIFGVLIAVGYSADVLRKDTAIQWGTGVILAGAVGEIVAVLWRG